MRAHWLASITLLGAARVATADPATGAQLQHDAEALASKHDYIGAVAKFREAYTADPRPELVCDIGVAFYKQPDLPRAQRYLKQCIDAGSSLDKAFLDRITGALKATEAALAKGDFTPVDFLVQPASAVISVAGWTADDSLGPARRAWLPFGSYALTIHAEGYVDKTLQVAATAHAVQVVGISLDKTPEVTPPPIVAPPVVTPPPIVAPKQQVAPLATRSHVPAIAATAGTAVVALTGTLFYLSARSRANDAGNAATQSDYDSIVSSVHSRESVGFALWGLSAVGIAASVYLWHSETAVEVTPTGVTLHGTF